MSAADLGALSTSENKGSVCIDPTHLTGTIYDGKTDIRLVSLPLYLLFPFESSLDDTTFEPATFDKFAVAHPFFKKWFTSIDIATKHEAIITKLSKDAAILPSGSLIPVKFKLADATRDDQIQALLERF